MNTRSTVVVIAGHDPSGGAGIIADAQAIQACGAHAATVITALTVQSSQQFHALEPVASALLQQQLTVLANEGPIGAIKIGLIPNIEVLTTVVAWLEQWALPRAIPVVVDPVIAAGSGQTMNAIATHPAFHALYELTTILTPNSDEALALSGQASLAEAAQWLVEQGCDHVLVTGGHLPELRNGLRNQLYGPEPQHWLLHRIQGEFRGTGCRLSSAIAAKLACGMSLIQAIEAAQQYMAHCLNAAYPLNETATKLIPSG